MAVISRGGANTESLLLLTNRGVSVMRDMGVRDKDNERMPSAPSVFCVSCCTLLKRINIILALSTPNPLWVMRRDEIRRAEEEKKMETELAFVFLAKHLASIVSRRKNCDG